MPDYDFRMTGLIMSMTYRRQ